MVTEKPCKQLDSLQNKKVELVQPVKMKIYQNNAEKTYAD